jgi:hypothetical protein
MMHGSAEKDRDAKGSKMENNVSVDEESSIVQRMERYTGNLRIIQ